MSGGHRGIDSHTTRKWLTTLTHTTSLDHTGTSFDDLIDSGYHTLSKDLSLVAFTPVLVIMCIYNPMSRSCAFAPPCLIYLPFVCSLMHLPLMYCANLNLAGVVPYE